MWAKPHRVVAALAAIDTWDFASLPRMAQPSAFKKCTTATHPAAPLGSGELCDEE